MPSFYIRSFKIVDLILFFEGQLYIVQAGLELLILLLGDLLTWTPLVCFPFSFPLGLSQKAEKPDFQLFKWESTTAHTASHWGRWGFLAARPGW